MRRLILLGVLMLFPVSAWAGQLILSWTDNSTDEQGFKVERCQLIVPATSCIVYIQIAAVPALLDTGGTKTYTSAGLAVGSTWCYRVRAYNQTGNSGYSNEACGTVAALSVPLDPANLMVQ